MLKAITSAEIQKIIVMKYGGRTDMTSFWITETTIDSYNTGLLYPEKKIVLLSTQITDNRIKWRENENYIKLFKVEIDGEDIKKVKHLHNLDEYSNHKGIAYFIYGDYIYFIGDERDSYENKDVTIYYTQRRSYPMATGTKNVIYEEISHLGWYFLLYLIRESNVFKMTVDMGEYAGYEILDNINAFKAEIFEGYIKKNLDRIENEIKQLQETNVNNKVS